MFSHFSLGTEGLAPGIFKHFRVASLGYDFEIEVIITPISPDGGGAGFGVPDLNNYLVTVRIRHKKRTWETSKQLNNTGLSRLEKVIASFTYAAKMINSTKVYVSWGFSKILKLISINITKKQFKE